MNKHRSIKQTNKHRRVYGVVITALLITGAPIVVSAQEEAVVLEEIIVTARKREENLRDVPVSISVIDDTFIKNAGILDQFDLFENVPGIQYNQDHDRQGVRAAVRGVQSNAQNPIRAKVTSFIDGIPVLGQTGSLQFHGIQRIEVMRGPQSAAFGRATFAGAINYVTKNPGDEFDASFSAGTSDLGRNVAAVSLSGPLTDTLGIIVDASYDEYRGADEWVSTDGITLGSTSTKYITSKLVWEPTNNFDMNLRFMHLETDDDPPLQWNIPGAELAACTNFTLPNGRGYVQGEWSCDPSIPEGGAPQNIHPEETLEEGTYAYYQAQTFSVLDPGSYVKRNRVQGELNFLLKNDTLIQVLASHSEDKLRRWFDVDRSDSVPRFRPNGTMLGGNVRARANPNTINESYGEIRWVSSGDQPLRWVVGASIYDYTLNTDFVDQLAGSILGLEDEANGGNPFSPVAINSDIATNSGIFGNLTWDVSDRTTVSAEVRFQRDDVNSSSHLTNFTFNNLTNSIQPRLAINHTINKNWSTYGQVSSGTNAAGVNISFLDENRQASLAAAKAAGVVTYETDHFLSYKEERVTNFEIGIKGNALDNRLRLSASVYHMKWADMIQPGGIDWDGDWNDGSFDPDGRIFNVTGGGGFQNMGDANMSGIELEADWRATDKWRFKGGFAYAKAKFADSCLGDPVSKGYEPTWLIEDGAPYDCYRVDGNDLYRQPDTTLSLSTTYTGLLGTGDWHWSARLGGIYSSKQYLDVMNLAYLPSKTIINASLSFSNENVNVTLFGNNLTDNDTPHNLQFNRDWNLPGNTFGFNVRPRSPTEIGARISYNF